MWWMPNKRQVARESLAMVGALAGAMLAVTCDRPMRQYFRAERIEARRIMRRSVRPRYIESGTAKADLAWLRDTLGEVHEFALEANNQPEAYTPGWGASMDWADVCRLAEAAR